MHGRLEFGFVCQHCQDAIVLPAKSHLGRLGYGYYGPIFKPEENGSWPIRYVCQQCGPESRIATKEIREIRQGTHDDEHLWLFVFLLKTPQNSDRSLQIYTKGLKNGAQNEIIHNVLIRPGILKNQEQITDIQLKTAKNLNVAKS